MTESSGRDRARQAVAAQMSAFDWNTSDLARNAAVDVGTVGDFLNGSRWPQSATRSKLARALSWTSESIDLIVRGDDPRQDDTETVGDAPQDDAVLASLPAEALEGLGAAERAEVIAAAKLSALQTARAIRRRLDDER